MPATRLLFSLTAIVAIAGAGIGIATSSPAPAGSEYLCPNGDRITVAPADGTVRVRTGAGVFSLGSADSDGRYRTGAISVDLVTRTVEMGHDEQGKALRCAPLRQRT